MFGELVTRGLVLVLGYAYPAFQCFKTVEKNRVEIQELKFWCQYWIIVAVLTILERIGDIFVSWLPMYGEMKLALFIYLWYPKTMGTDFVYDSLLRPYVTKHETGIDQSLIEFRERAWNLAIYYWQNCTELGSEKILQFLQFVGSQSARMTHSNSENRADRARSNDDPQSSTIFRMFKNKRQAPVPPPGPSTSYRAETPTSESIQVQLNNQAQSIRVEDILIPNSEKSGVDKHLNSRIKFRRSKGSN